MPKDRIVIYVSGGVVQEVVCDKKHDVILVDMDNIEAGDAFDRSLYPIDVGTKKVEAVLKEAEKESNKVQDANSDAEEKE